MLIRGIIVGGKVAEFANFSEIGHISQGSRVEKNYFGLTHSIFRVKYGLWENPTVRKLPPAESVSPTEYKTASMNASLRLIFVFICVCCCSFLSAQETEISGHVEDTDGISLIGATVKVANSVVGAVTDLEGHYELEVPTGRIRLIFSYVGYQTLDTFIQVALADRDLEVDVVLRPAVLEVPEVIVFGRRAVGQAQALRIQQASPQQVSVVHAELFNKYPDVSLGETVQRIPGVTITRRQGEAEFVQIRGLPEQFSVVSINGQRLPAIRAEADRASSLDLIPTNLIEEVYVNKGRTADMDADLIGGSIDFRLRQPDERLEMLFQGGLGANFQNSPLRAVDRTVGQLSAFVNSELSEEKVYALAGGSYFTNGRNAAERLVERGFTGTENAAVSRFRPTDTDRIAEKIGAIGAIELRPSIYNRLRLSYNFSRSEDEFIRRQSTFDFDRNREFRETTNWRESRDINLVTLEVENNFKRFKLDYALSFAYGREDIPQRLRYRYESENEDFADLDDFPTAASGSATSLSLRRLAYESLRLEENIAIAGANLTFFTNEQQTSFFRTGIRYRISDRRFGSQRELFNFTDDRSTIGRGAFGLQGVYATDPEFRALNTGLGPDNFDPLNADNAFESEEEIVGGYFMYQVNVNARLSLSTGIRVEGTELEYLRPSDQDSSRLAYTNVLPSLNLTYRYKLDRQFRFNYYEAIGRPAYATLFPNEQLQLGDREIIQGNEAAQTVFSRNFNLGWERYGRRDGLLSVSFYASLLDNPFVRDTRYEERDDAPFRVTTISNAKSAILAGVELASYQNLGFLGEAFRFFNVNATYSYNYSQVSSDDPLQDGLPLLSSPRSNLGLSAVYQNDNSGFTLVVAGNYRDRTLIREQDGQPIYRADILTLDVAADWRFYKNFSLYLRGNNLTNPLLEEYVGDGQDQLYSSEQFGSWAVAGVRWQL